jgi:hypothetical protein
MDGFLLNDKGEAAFLVQLDKVRHWTGAYLEPQKRPEPKLIGKDWHLSFVIPQGNRPYLVGK